MKKFLLQQKRKRSYPRLLLPSFQLALFAISPLMPVIHRSLLCEFLQNLWKLSKPVVVSTSWEIKFHKLFWGHDFGSVRWTRNVDLVHRRGCTSGLMETDSILAHCVIYCALCKPAKEKLWCLLPITDSSGLRGINDVSIYTTICKRLKCSTVTFALQPTFTDLVRHHDDAESHWKSP